MTAGTGPAARRAHLSVTHAIKEGRLIRQLCEVCGHKLGEAHHDDYDRPLDVRWLCDKHHMQFHCWLARRKMSREVGWGDDFLNSQEAANLIGVTTANLYALHDQLETVSNGLNRRLYRASSVRKLVNHFARINVFLANA